MDAAAFAMMDGVVGGALLDKPPKLASPEEAAAATAAAMAAAVAIATQTPAATTASTSVVRMLSPVQGSARAHAAPAAMPLSTSLEVVDLMVVDSTPSEGLDVGTMTNDDGRGGEVASPSVGALARPEAHGKGQAARPTEQQHSASVEEKSTVEKTLPSPQQHFGTPGSIVSESNGSGLGAVRKAQSLLLQQQRSSKYSMSPVLVAVINSASGRSVADSEISERTMDQSGSSSGGGGKASPAGAKKAVSENGVCKASYSTMDRTQTTDGAKGANVIAAAVAAAAASPLRSSSAAAMRSCKSGGCHSTTDVPPNSTSEHNDTSDTSTASSVSSPAAMNSNARGAQAVGISGGSCSGSVVTTRHQQAASPFTVATIAATAAATVPINTFGMSSSGSTNAITAGAVLVTSRVTTAARRAGTRASDLFDKSEDFVGTPPSCFGSSFGALSAMDPERRREGDGTRMSRACGAARRHQPLTSGRMLQDTTSEDASDEYDGDDEYVDVSVMDSPSPMSVRSTLSSVAPPSQQPPAATAVGGGIRRAVPSTIKSALEDAPSAIQMTEAYQHNVVHSERKGASREPIARALTEEESDSCGALRRCGNNNEDSGGGRRLPNSSGNGGGMRTEGATRGHKKVRKCRGAGAWFSVVSLHVWRGRKLARTCCPDAMERPCAFGHNERPYGLAD